MLWLGWQAMGVIKRTKTVGMGTHPRSIYHESALSRAQERSQGVRDALGNLRGYQEFLHFPGSLSNAAKH